MSGISYFSNPQAEAAKNFEMIQRRQVLKAKIGRLHDELTLHADSWSKLARFVADVPEDATFEVGDRIKAMRPDWSRPGTAKPVQSVVVDVPGRHFDQAALTLLLTDLADIQKELAQVSGFVRGLGLDI